MSPYKVLVENALQKAAKSVLPEHRAKTFTSYNFRRLSELLPGAAYLAGSLNKVREAGAAGG